MRHFRDGRLPTDLRRAIATRLVVPLLEHTTPPAARDALALVIREGLDALRAPMPPLPGIGLSRSPPNCVILRACYDVNVLSALA